MRLAVALVLLVVLAGCSDGAKDTGGAGDPSSSSTTSPGPAGTPTNGTANAAPRWEVGQSWTWRLESGTMMQPLEATSVVLAAGSSDHDVGTTNVEDASRMYPFHLVGFGAVDAATLAWEAHGTPVQLLRFPLVHGDRFSADFWSAPGADVVIEEAPVATPGGAERGFRSTVYYAGTESIFMQAEYAPSLGQFVRVRTYFGGDSDFATAILTGVGSNGTGQPFRVTELARWSANAGDATTLQPRQFSVAAPFDDLLLACFITGQGEGSVTVAGPRGGTSTCNGLQGGTGTGTTYHWAYATAVEGPAAARVLPVGEASVTLEAFGVDTTPPA